MAAAAGATTTGSGRSIRRERSPAITWRNTPNAYVRLLGDRQGIEKVTTTWNKVVIDKSDELTRVARALTELAIKVPVLAFANNHYAGFGPETADALARICRESFAS